MPEFQSLLTKQLRRAGLDSESSPAPDEWRAFLVRINRTYSENDQERYLLERSLMISSEEMRDVYQRLRESENRYALAAEGANDGLWDWDLTVDRAYYSQRWFEIMGIEPRQDHETGRELWFERIHPADQETVVDEFEAHLTGETKHFENEHMIIQPDNEHRWVLCRGLAIRDKEGKAIRIAGSLTDITERKLQEQKMAHDAIHDPLTGLPNRKSLMNRIDRSLQRVLIDSSFSFGLFFVDLDRFKIVNDSLGHQHGDNLLIEVSSRLNTVVRPSDMVARLGGDEFVLLVDNVGNRAELEVIANRVLESLRKPIEIGGHEIHMSASIGIAVASPDYNRSEDILRDADFAMYKAKARGKGHFEFFDVKTQSPAVSELTMEFDMRKALERDEFVLHYQPIVALLTEEVIGFESLIRWQHPTLGLIPPAEFIPIAEETGHILAIGEWVLQESCSQMKKWQDLIPEARDLVISVNLSARQLEHKDLTDQIRATLKKTRIDPKSLKLEITESVIMNNAEQAISAVKSLREMGVRVSIDDFGTGYSSLSYLHRFPIDTLKVDRSFISRIEESEGAQIVQTIVTLAYTLGMDVVAEGVETLEQSKFLQNMNCNYGQGYFYSRPVDGNAATEIVHKLKKPGLMPPKKLVPDPTIKTLRSR